MFLILSPKFDLRCGACGIGIAGFTTSAGYVGPHFRVDHDISLLVPEIWCRMRVHERDPKFLIENGYLEPVCDFCVDGRNCLMPEPERLARTALVRDYRPSPS